MKKNFVRIFFAAVFVIANICGSISQTFTPQIAKTELPTKQIVLLTGSPTFRPTATPIVITPTPTVTPSPDVEDLFYTVESGDTLSEISVKTGVSLEDLVSFNNLADANWIYAGQVLSLMADPEMRKVAMEEPGKKILVILSEQSVYAYEDNVLIKQFLASTGTWQHPTVVGRYLIWIKFEADDMSGGEGVDAYYLPAVPWTMYFYQSYGIHGTYWHNNFGHPMSHGCVNLSIPDADWLFHWASVGTPVWVIP